VVPYFDDFKVTYTPSKLIQATDYYPFGASHRSSWTRETATPNPYLYNGGAEKNERTGWYETAFRGYDAYTGRFQQVDPLADMFGGLNPYHYGYNNPTNFNDPMGLWGKKNSGGGNEKYDEPQDASTGGGQNSQTPMDFPEFTDLFNPSEYAAAAYGGAGEQFGGGFTSGAYYGVGSGQGSLAHQQFVNRNGGHAYYTNANYYDYSLEGAWILMGIQ